LTEYFAYYHRVDICLDCFPFNGSSTTGDGLWMGVPTLTLMGDTLQSRAGQAWLRHFGRNDFVADSPDRFVEIGVGWGQRLPELSRIRAGLRTQILNTHSCHPESVARALEFALRSMWRRWCAGQAPVSFTVPQQVWHTTMGRTRV
jgi:predicted O-linked N-acetylglucosamine transferase (SPINDLY family)